MKAYNVQPKANKYGQRVTIDQFNVEATGNTVRIWGIKAEGMRWPVSFDKTFVLGEKVVYDSYNLTYTAPLIKVTAKTATVDVNSYYRSNVKRLDLYTFVWWNWDYDAERTKMDNYAISMTI